MNPYNIDQSKFSGSEKVTNERDILKLKLLVQIKMIIEYMETYEILNLTGLDKSDLSRIRILSFQRFSIDRLINILEKLGYVANLSVTRSKKASLEAPPNLW